MYNWVTLLHSRNEENTVKTEFSQLKKKKQQQCLEGAD